MKYSCLAQVTYSLSKLRTIYFSPFPKLISPFLIRFSLLCSIFYARLTKFLCSVAFLTVGIFLRAISSLKYGLFCPGAHLSTSAILGVSAIDHNWMKDKCVLHCIVLLCAGNDTGICRSYLRNSAAEAVLLHHHLHFDG